MNEREIYNYILKIQSIAKMGLTYSKDPYAIQNYQEINDLSRDFLEHFEQIKLDRPNYFEKNIYPTPNVSVRTVILNQEKDQVLLVREVSGGYSLPGGWADLYETPSEAAKKECLQEAGADVNIVKLSGVFSHMPLDKHNSGFIPDYVLVFLGEIISLSNHHDFETDDVRFFPINDLPECSRKCHKEEMQRMIQCALDDKAVFD